MTFVLAGSAGDGLDSSKVTESPPLSKTVNGAGTADNASCTTVSAGAGADNEGAKLLPLDPAKASIPAPGAACKPPAGAGDDAAGANGSITAAAVEIACAEEGTPHGKRSSRAFHLQNAPSYGSFRGSEY